MRDGRKEYVADGYGPLDLTALLQSDSVDAIIGLCALSVGRDMPLGSRYDRFLALCRMMPMMNGHDEQARIRAILAKGFGIECDLSMQTADEVWMKTADILLFCPCIPTVTADDIAQFYTSAPHSLPAASELPHLPTNLFLGDASSLEQWEPAILAWADAHAPNGFCVTLDANFDFCAPNPYHVRLALGASVRTRDCVDMLMAQSLRILSPVLQERGGELRILADCRGEAVTGLLSYLEKHVGLPRVRWSTASEQTRECLLDFSLRPHECLISPALRCSGQDVSRGEIDLYSRRFPAGLLVMTVD